MDRRYLSIIILAVIILLLIVCLWLYKRFISKSSTKRPKNKRVIEGFEASDGLAIDSENPDLTEGSVFGSVPQSVSMALNKKAQMRGATDDLKNKLKESTDPNLKGLPKMAVKLLKVDPNPSDIETMLNDKINEKIQEATGSGVTIDDIKKDLKKSITTMATDAAKTTVNKKIKDQLGVDLTVDDIKNNPKFAAKIAAAALASKALSDKFGIDIKPEDMAENPILAAKTAALALADKTIADKLGVNVTVEQIRTDPALAARVAALALANKQIKDKLGLDVTVEDMMANPALAAKTAATAVANKAIHDQLGIDVTIDDIRSNPALATKMAVTQLGSNYIKKKYGIDLDPEEIRKNPLHAAEIAASLLAENQINSMLGKKGLAPISVDKFMKDPVGAAKDYAIEMAKAKAKEQIKKYSEKAGAYVVKKIEEKVSAMSQKMALEMGEKQAEKMMEKVVEHQVEVIGEKVIVAEAEEAAVDATGPATFGIGFAIGLLMQAITLAAQALQIAMAIKLKGETGWCPPEFHTLTENWPPWCLELIGAIPSLGELFVAMFPYMCFSEAKCNPGTEELFGGLCYPNCDAGYDGAGPVCWSHYESIGVGVLRGCPSGWTDDGLICRESITWDPCPRGWNDDGALCRAPLTYKPCQPGWKDDGLLCREPTWHDPCPPGWHDDGASCRDEMTLAACPSGWKDEGLTCRAPITTDPCPSGWNEDGPLSCRANVYHDPCPGGWHDDGATCRADLYTDGCCSKGLFGECYGCLRGGQVEGRALKGGQVEPRKTHGGQIEGKVRGGAVELRPLKGGSVVTKDRDSQGQIEPKGSHGGRLIGKMNLAQDGGSMLSCPGDHPDYIDGLCYRSCPTKSRPPGIITRQVPKWIRDRPTFNQDVAQANLDAEKAKENPDTNALNNLQKALGDAIDADAKAPLPQGTPYKLNPEWLKEAKKRADYTDTPPDPKMADFKVESLAVQVEIPASVQLKHAPGAPYQCVGEHGTSYGRGAGRPAITMVLQDVAPPPQLPPAHMSSHYAEDPNTECVIDYSSPKALNDMCQFYYESAAHAAKMDGTTRTFETITRVKAVIASSEQSADILCEISTLTVDGETGKEIYRTPLNDSADRRFYFAKVDAICSFIVAGCTNINDTGPDVKNPGGGVKGVDFTPTISSCASLMMTRTKCTDETNVKVMIALYNRSEPDAVVQTVVAGDATGPSKCTIVWTEKDDVKKAGVFDYSQESNCSFTIAGYNDANVDEVNVPDLAKPLVLNESLAPEVSLDGCPDTNCRDAVLIQRMINVYNNKSKNKIQSITKSITPDPLRCEVEANILMNNTNTVKTGTLAFDLVKPSSDVCLFNVKHIGAIGSGTNIKASTPTLQQMINPGSITLITKAVNSTVKALGLKTKDVTDAVGQASQIRDSTVSDFGQMQTLGNCSSQCTDPDVLSAITTYYNNANYPSTRTGVTKKTMKSILKAGTASNTECDITFEETQEVYSDLYNSEPQVTTTTKTQRFTMADSGGCVFDVVKAPVDEGFRNVSGFQGLPGVASKRSGAHGLPIGRIPKTVSRFQKKSVSGFQSGSDGPFKMPPTVNAATPSLNPPFTNEGCVLKCEDNDLMDALNNSVSSQTEGFKGRASSNPWFSSLFEAFQDSDPIDTLDETIPDNSATLGDTEPTPKAIASTTLKKVNRALKVNTTTCEYEVVYDATNVDTNGTSTQVNNEVGYYQATFTKDPASCSFTLSSAAKSTDPILPSVPANKSVSVGYNF